MYPCYIMFGSTQKYFKEDLKQSYKWNQFVISKCIAFSLSFLFYFFGLFCRNLGRDSQGFSLARATSKNGENPTSPEGKSEQ